MDDRSLKIEIDELIVYGTEIHHLGMYKCASDDINGGDIDSDTKKYLQNIEKKLKDFKRHYQIWYSRATRCVRTLAPERLDEFVTYYTGAKNIRKLDFLSAGITHFFQGLVTTRMLEKENYFGKITSGMEQQINILDGLSENIDNSIFNIESGIYFDVFRTELSISEDLLKSNQYRASGAICGVVIEQHLKFSCANHGIKFRKKHLSISDYNEALKRDDIIDVVMWRLITRCSDIRNYCVHAKERDPKHSEIEDLIQAANKIIVEVV